MSLRMSSSTLFLVTLMLLGVASAHNITKVLEKEDDYSQFNQMLSETGVAKEINKRKSVTVLAVPNDAIGGLSGKDPEELKSILKTHVILDYYDELKLKGLKKSTEMTTMFQSTGVAHYHQGFLNVTKKSDGVYFGSAVKNAQRDSKLSGSVASMPYNLSVLAIDHPISTPGLDAGAPYAAPPKKAEAPTPEEAESPSPDSESPDEAPAPGPDADASSPASAPGPDADEAAADGKSSAPEKLIGSSIVLAAVLASYIAAF